MRKYRAVLEKVTVERMTIEFTADNLEAAAVIAERATREERVRGVTITKAYDTGHVSERERVSSVREA